MRSWLLSLLIVPMSSGATGFWDQGMLQLGTRTEYPSGVGATSNLELSYTGPGAEGCLFDANNNYFGCPGVSPDGRPPRADGLPLWYGGLEVEPACRGDVTRIGDSWMGCLRYSSSSPYLLNNPGANYWVISANSDPSFDQCNSGPPNYSFPVVPVSGSGLFKVSASPSLHRFDMIIDAGAHDFFCAKSGANHYTIPFLSVGAHVGRGQSLPIGQMNKANPHSFKVQFVSWRWPGTTFGCKAGTADICSASGSGVHAGFFMETVWGGVPRQIQVDLYGEGVHGGTAPSIQHSKWNWPVKSSFFFPGADIAFFNLPGLASACGISIPPLTTSSTSYTVYATDIFKCASDQGLFTQPMPAGDVPLNGFHWFQESSGTAGRFYWVVQDATAS